MKWVRDRARSMIRMTINSHFWIRWVWFVRVCINQKQKVWLSSDTRLNCNVWTLKSVSYRQHSSMNKLTNSISYEKLECSQKDRLILITLPLRVLPYIRLIENVKWNCRKKASHTETAAKTRTKCSKRTKKKIATTTTMAMML